MTAEEHWDVFPARTADEHKVLHKVLTWIFRFDDVLDAEKLHAALCRLFEIGGWRKCAGRYAYNSNGRLEIRTPKVFSQDYTAVSFGKQTSPLKIEEHSIAKNVPRETQDPSIHTLPADIRSLAGSAALDVAELIERNLSPVSLDVTTFENGTIVLLSWPHTLMDAAGQTALLQNWSHILAGREDNIIPAAPNQDEDVLDTVVNIAELHGIHPSLVWQILYILRYMWETYHAHPTKKIIHLPSPSLRRIHQDASTDLPKESFLTENDILTAWLAKLYTSSHPTPRPCSILQIYNLRPKLLPGNIPQIHLQNIHTTLPIFLPRETSSASLTYVALIHRAQLSEKTTVENLRQALYTQQILRPVLPAYLTAESLDSLLFPINNLTKCNFYEVVDFSPAIVVGSSRDGYGGGDHGGLGRKDGEKADRQGRGKTRRGRLVSWYNRPLAPERRVMSQGMMLGKDLDGGMSILAAFPEKTWEVVERELENLSGETEEQGK